jgi:sugar O-acyltransferase (sialic acid O-acetyltransferase NeuD family)
MNPCIVLGGGGHGSVVIDTLIACGAQIVGIVDVRHVHIEGVTYLGTEEAVLRYATNAVALVNGIGSVGSSELRESVFMRFRTQGYSFKTIVHPTATVSTRVTLGDGVQVMAGAIIQPGTTIGDNTIVNTGAIVDHDCQIGAHVHIAPGAVLSGSVSVGDRAHIGTGASVRNGISIGERAIVGVGAAVVRPIETGDTVMGVPAKRMTK